jgi:hypothetical protein
VYKDSPVLQVMDMIGWNKLHATCESIMKLPGLDDFVKPGWTINLSRYRD